MPLGDENGLFFGAMSIGNITDLRTCLSGQGLTAVATGFLGTWLFLSYAHQVCRRWSVITRRHLPFRQLRGDTPRFWAVSTCFLRSDRLLPSPRNALFCESVAHGHIILGGRILKLNLNIGRRGVWQW